MFGGFSFCFKITISLTSPSFKQLPTYHMSHTAALLLSAIHHSRKHDWGGKGRGVMKQQKRSKTLPHLGFPRCVSFTAAPTMNLWWRAKALWKGSGPVCSCKSPTKNQPQSTHKHSHSLSLHKLRTLGPDPKPTGRAHQLQQAPDQPEKTKCFYSDWSILMFFYIFFKPH